MATAPEPPTGPSGGPAPGRMSDPAGGPASGPAARSTSPSAAASAPGASRSATGPASSAAGPAALLPAEVAARPPRLTRLGRAFVVLTLLAAVLAVVLESQYVFLLFNTLLAMLLVASTLARRSLRGLRVRRTVQHPIFSHQPFEVTLAFANHRGLPVACLRVIDGPWPNERVRHDTVAEVFVPLVPARGEATVMYRARVFGRGWGEWSHVRIGTDAPFGLFRSELVLPCPGRELVYPRVLPAIAQVPLEALFAPSESDPRFGSRGSEEFIGLRDFRPGDNPRWIHWKSSARMPSQLLVREFDSPRVRRVVLAVETRVGDADRRKLLRRLENSVSIAASLAGTLVRSTPALTLVTASPEPLVLELTPDSPSAWELLEALAVLEPSRDWGIRELLGLLPAAKLEDAAVVAVTLRTEPDLLGEYPGLAMVSAERPSRLLVRERRAGTSAGGADRFRRA